MVSPEFATGFMGLPRGWMFHTAIPDTIRAQHPILKLARWPVRHKTISLFSGIGALDLALSRWCSTCAYVEKDAFSRSILAARMRDGCLDAAQLHEDVRDFHMGEHVDGLVAGFPCIDISVAGRREGLQGEHSSLVHHVFRLADETECSWIFLENVAAIRSMTHVWQVLLAELLRRGFDCCWITVAASHVGAPHRRARWFLHGRRGQRKLFADPQVAPPALPATALLWNPPGRPLPSEWLVRERSDEGRSILRALGNAVVPQQGCFAAQWLAQCQ